MVLFSYRKGMAYLYPHYAVCPGWIFYPSDKADWLALSGACLFSGQYLYRIQLGHVVVCIKFWGQKSQLFNPMPSLSIPIASFLFFAETQKGAIRRHCFFIARTFVYNRSTSFRTGQCAPSWYFTHVDKNHKNLLLENFLEKRRLQTRKLSQIPLTLRRNCQSEKHIGQYHLIMVALIRLIKLFCGTPLGLQKL